MLSCVSIQALVSGWDISNHMYVLQSWESGVALLLHHDPRTMGGHAIIEIYINKHTNY